MTLFLKIAVAVVFCFSAVLIIMHLVFSNKANDVIGRMREICLIHRIANPNMGESIYGLVLFEGNYYNLRVKINDYETFVNELEAFIADVEERYSKMSKFFISRMEEALNWKMERNYQKIEKIKSEIRLNR